MLKVYNKDNMTFDLKKDVKDVPWAEMIFADCIYESLDFSWTEKYWNYLGENGIFVIMTDFHTVSEIDVHMKNNLGAKRISKLVWKNEWGKPPSNKFHECYDDILIYSKSGKWGFDKNKIQVPKATAKSKRLNPSGRTTKTATAWIDDITLTTVAKERIKDGDKLVRWQKPKELLRRISTPFLRKGALVLDPFMGSGTMGEVCYDEGWHYIGIENEKRIFNLAKKRLKPFLNNTDYIPF